MVEIIRLPPVFQRWDTTEAIIRKHLIGQIPADEEEEIIARFKEVYDRLPSQIGEISLPLDGLEHLSDKDLDAVYASLGAAVDQIQERLQKFAGHVFGEVFALVLESSRIEARLDHKTTA